MKLILTSEYSKHVIKSRTLPYTSRFSNLCYQATNLTVQILISDHSKHFLKAHTFLAPVNKVISAFCLAVIPQSRMTVLKQGDIFSNIYICKERYGSLDKYHIYIYYICRKRYIYVKKRYGLVWYAKFSSGACKKGRLGPWCWRK